MLVDILAKPQLKPQPAGTSRKILCRRLISLSFGKNRGSRAPWGNLRSAFPSAARLLASTLFHRYPQQVQQGGKTEPSPIVLSYF
jgi:hypothetical protein